MRNLHYLSHALAGCLLLPALALLGGCSGSSPSEPDVPALGGGEGGPVVSSAVPRLIPPNATLDLRVFGLGFEDGSRVDLVAGGAPTPKVRTDSTRFVSPGEVVATITTAPDVPLGTYSLVLTGPNGKQGVGTELIDVDSTSGIQVNTSTTSTSGADQPGNGYSVLIDGAPSGGQPVSPTGSKAVTGLSAGEHSVGLAGVPEDCAVSGDNPRMVNIPRGTIVQVFFDIVCTAPPPPPPPPTSGDVLAFTAVSSGDSDIYWMTPDGLGPVNLTNSPGPDWWPDWSPDGSRIAFAGADVPGGELQIYVIRVDGSNVRQHLTAGTCQRWSPDGSRIAFLTGDQIFVVRADGSEVRSLTTARTCAMRWSPDGSKIAFVNQDPWDYYFDHVALYVMNSDGTGMRRLSPESEIATGIPAWSPDGSRIAYDAKGGPDHREISIVQSDGGNHVRLTPDPGLDASDPSWSPDGSKIAFTRSTTVTGGPALPDYDIFVVDANGANLRRLTTDAGFATGPVWSPDGSRIAFSLFPREGTSSIAIINSDGTGRRTLVTGGFGPTWRPRRP